MNNKKKFNLSESAPTGISHSELKMPLNFPPLGNFLMAIAGSEAVKGRVLNWVFSEGLMEASKNREVLYQMVLKVMEPITKPNNATNVVTKPNMPFKKAVNEMAFKPEDIVGPDYDDAEEIKSVDLFSPQAWARSNYLKRADQIFRRTHGLGILAYYEKNLEPKTMTIDIDDQKGTRVIFDLPTIRQKVQAKKLTPFYFGSRLNESTGEIKIGYIQFVEKGDWLPSVHPRALINSNDQNGPSLEPVTTIDPDTKKIDTSRAVEVRNNKIQYNFQGGGFIPSKERADEQVRNMRFYFIKAASKDPSIPEEDKAYINSIAEFISQLQQTEVSIKGKGKAAGKAGMENMRSGTEDRPLPDDISTFKNLIAKGLQQPLKGFDEASFINIDGIGRNIESSSELQAINPDEGWWMRDPIKKGKVIIKFSKLHREAIFNKIFERESEGVYTGRLRYNTVKGLQYESSNGVQNIFNPNSKLNVSAIVNRAFDKDFKLKKDLSMTVFRLPTAEDYKKIGKVQPQSEADWSQLGRPKKLGQVKKELKGFTPFMPEGNETVKKLIDMGFNWESSKKDQNENPLLPTDDYEPSSAFLKNPAGIRIKIAKEGQLWFAYFPSDFATDEEEVLKGHGVDVNAPLLGAKGSVFKSSRAGHIEAMAVGPKAWKVIEQELLKGPNGKLGEWEDWSKTPETDGPVYDNIWSIPSVVRGVQQAKAWFNKIHNSEAMRQWFRTSNMAEVLGGETSSEAKPADHFDQTELQQWAVEALKLHSNDPAFQLGWTSQAQWDANTNSKNTLDDYLQTEFEKKLFGGNKKAYGIRALLMKTDAYGDIAKDNNELQQLIDQKIEEKIKEARAKQNIESFFILPVFDERNPQGERLTPEVYKAYALNALEFRKRKVAIYVVNKMGEKLRINKDKATVPMPQGKTKEGESTQVDFADKGYLDMRGEYEPEDISHIQKLDDLYAKLGISPQDIISSPTKVVNKISQAVRGGQQTAPQVGSKTTSTQQPKNPLQGMTVQDLLKKVQEERARLLAKQAQRTTQASPSAPTSAQPKPTIQPPTPTTPVTPERQIDKAALLQKLQLFKAKNAPKTEAFTSFRTWQNLFIKEMTGTSAVYDKKFRKPKAGTGFNWWGAPGNIGGTSISGDVETANSDPDGTKGIKHARKQPK